MNILNFDTLKYAKRLKAAGMDPLLAEEQAAAMEKRSLRKLRTDDDVASDSIQLMKDVRTEDINSAVT
jgi:hypothetical protein